VKLRFVLVCLTCGALGVYLAVFSIRLRRSAEGNLAQQAQLARQSVKEITRRRIVYREERVESGMTFTDMLGDLGADSGTISKIIACAQPVFDFRGFTAGHSVTVGCSQAEGIREVRYRIDDDRMLSITAKDNDFRAKIERIPSQTNDTVVAGQIDDSLFNAITGAREKPELALRLADIFRYDVDFYTDPQPGDTFRVLVEKKISLADQVLGYERILAAEYVNAGKKYQAVLFRDSGGTPAYYTPDGKSLRKAFLHSPLRYAAPLTSGFSYHRFHPILKIYRPHLGVDYGAPVGTPVQAVASGRVVYAGWRGGAGRAVCLQHARGYQTSYFHLSRILVHAGQRVTQGQRIGLVGQTGLATGPHLDFRVRRHGVFLNFAKLRLPPAAPVAKSQWKQFAAARDHWLAMMNSPQQIVAHAQTPPDLAGARR
jgi:murein DD-endopeptidase MepM/ murein hydrolase activator NlpD